MAAKARYMNSLRTEKMIYDAYTKLLWQKPMSKIKRVDVYSDYHLHVEFNMSFAQFELGLDAIETTPA